MRRKKQALSQVECIHILREATSGVLCIVDGSAPYALPMSFVYFRGKLYFHCARQGRKISAIDSCSQACFTIIDKDQVDPAHFMTHYRSLIVEGGISIVEDPQEKWDSLEALTQKYSAPFMEEGRERMKKDLTRLHMLVMECEIISGKQGRVLALNKAKELDEKSF